MADQAHQGARAEGELLVPMVLMGNQVAQEKLVLLVQLVPLAQ